MHQPGFKDRVVVVTGGSGGLGWAMVRAFAGAGARVVAADLNPPPQAELEALGGTVVHHLLDVTDEAAWIGLFDAVEARWGTPDVLVNNAGFYKPNIPFEDMPLDLWRRHMAVNADGVFLGCKHAILRMKARGSGAVVNIGSGMSIKANPMGAAYCASKAAVLMTTKTAAAAAAAHGVRVNAVLPGAVPTAMLMGNRMEGEDEDAMIARIEAYNPTGRLATAQDIARAVLFLADPANTALTGAHLAVDAGDMPGS